MNVRRSSFKHHCFGEAEYRAVHGRARDDMIEKAIDSAVAGRILSYIRDVVIVLSPDRKVRFVNPAARQLLERRDPLRVQGGRLTAASSLHARAVERAIDDACSASHADDQVVVMRGSSWPPLVLSIRCLADFGGDNVLILASDGHVEPARVEPSLRRCFRLTGSEAEVAVSLATGASSANIAAARGVRVNTIRTQIKAIAAKLGCATQSQISAIVRATPLSVDARD
jgi:DNA-binding CsgD family transcriptional regulator